LSLKTMRYALFLSFLDDFVETSPVRWFCTLSASLPAWNSGAFSLQELLGFSFISQRRIRSAPRAVSRSRLRELIFLLTHPLSSPLFLMGNRRGDCSEFLWALPRLSMPTSRALPQRIQCLFFAVALFSPPLGGGATRVLPPSARFLQFSFSSYVFETSDPFLPPRFGVLPDIYLFPPKLLFSLVQVSHPCLFFFRSFSSYNSPPLLFPSGI